MAPASHGTREPGWSRREFIRALTAAAAGVAWSGCTSASPATTSPSGAADAAPSGAWQQAWNELVAAAQREGRVLVWGPPTPEVRTHLPAAFKARFGIEMEYLGGRTSEQMAKLQAERMAGQYTLDAMIAGAQSMYTEGYPN